MFVVFGVDSGMLEGKFPTEKKAIGFIMSDLPSDDFWYCVTDIDGQYLAIVHQGQVWRVEV